jgi:hypothetical protein
VKSLVVSALLLLAIVSSAVAESQFSTAASEPILPPLIPWNGKSRALVVAKNDPWITPARRPISAHHQPMTKRSRGCESLSQQHRS